MKVSILALDPSPLVVPLIDEVYCTIMTSATLEPTDEYAKLIGLKNYVSLNVSLPLKPWRILVLITKGITTDYRRRKKDMYIKMAKRIQEIVRATPGNVGIFAASYEIIKGLLDIGLPEMIILISGFKSYASKGGAVLLGVQGGRNAEGEDFPGNEMKTVVVLGVPFAKPSPSTLEKIRYFEKKFPGKGRLFGYILPALRKASQAAGRPIRKPDDEGVIVLMDYRFLSRNILRLLPNWIRSNVHIVDDKDGVLENIINSFWLIRPS